MSKNRNFSKLVSSVDSTGKIANSDAISPAAVRSVERYDSAASLPIKGLQIGDRALAGNRLFISNGSGWYNFSYINFSPRITSGPSGAEFVLDNTAPETISLIASDSDGTPIIWSFTTSDSALDLATINNDSNGVFTVTGKSLTDILEAGYDSSGGSFTVTFKASDGIAFDADSASFTLTYSVGFDWGSVTEQAKIQASDKQDTDRFGNSVAISGDTVVVGAQNEDTGATDAGAAYIFTRSGSTWTQQAKIQASDKQDTDRFGNSVAIDGDTVVVGAQLEDTGGSNAGAAYIFTRSGSTWTQQAKIQASDKQASDNFGFSVAISGDTVVVGANNEDTGATDAGAAYIFTRSGSTWTEQAKIQASDKQATDRFGQSVAISGDTVVVGAFLEDTGATDAGAAYIFTRSGTTWTEQAKIQASDKQASDRFGISVAISGDTVIVGAYFEDTGGSNAGAAYIFTRSGSTWTEQQKIQASDKEANDSFGQVLAIDGDTVVVGAQLEDTGASNVGAAYIFTRSGSTWTQQAKIQASDKEAEDRFGNSVAIDGDTVVVGAQNEDTGATDAGAAYIFIPS